MEQSRHGHLNVIEDNKRVETALRESENRFRALFEQASVGVAEINAISGRFLRVNQKYSDITGYTIAEMLKLDFQTITYPADLADDLENMRLLVEGHIREFSMEKRYHRKDGQIVWIHLTVSPLWAGHETPTHHMAIVQDITERKQAEQMLKESETRYRTLVDLAPDAVGLFNAAGKVEMINQRGLQIYGYDAEAEVLGRPVLDFVPPEEHEHVAEFLHRLSEKRLPQTDDFTMLRKDGSRFVAAASMVPQLDANGMLIGFIGISRDITTRRESERLLRARYQELQSLHEISEVMLTSQDFKTMAESVLDKALVLAHCDWGLLRLVNRADNRLEPVAHRGYRQEENLLRHSSYQRERTTGRVLRVFEAKRTFVLDRVQEEPGLRVLKSEGIESAIVIPVFLETEIFGLLQIGSRTPRKFEPTLIKVLETLLRYFCIATQKNRFLNETLTSQSQLRELSARLVVAGEAERRNIARELHDEFGSLLTGLKLMLAAHDSAQKIQEMAIVDDLLSKIRYLSQNLRPLMLDHFGLLETLQWHLKDYTVQTGVQVDLQHSGLAIRFAPEIEIAAFRIVQEALTNVARHAQVDQAMVAVSADRRRLSIEIADEGVGFDRETTLTQASSAGLVGLRERTRLAGGTCKFTSAPGAGTRISVEIPLNNQA